MSTRAQRGFRGQRPPSRGQFASQPRGASSNARGAYRGASPGRLGGTIFMQDQPCTVDTRIKDGSDMAVVAHLDRSVPNNDLDPHSLPLRPNFGTQGKPITLRANYFPVTVQGKIYRYGVAIDLPDRNLSRGVKRRVFQLAEQTEAWKRAGLPGCVAHDNAEKLVASRQLPQPLTIRAPYYDEEEHPSQGGIEYTLTITFEEEVDQQILNACLDGHPVDSQALSKVLSTLNLVLTAHPSRTGVKIGRDDESKKNPDQRLFFDSPEPTNIGGGLTAREGFYVSVRPAHRQLMVNVNVTHAAFYKPQNFADALEEYHIFTKGDIGAFGTHVRVKTRHDNRIVMIQGLSKMNARQYTFKSEPYGKVTVEQYFKRKHGLELKHPNLPLLEGPGKSCYPAEVCDILPDQGFKGKLSNHGHTKEMVNAACKLPAANADEIVHRGVDKMGFRGSNPLLESFGVRVGTEMATVPARILDKPGLAYLFNKQAKIDARAASWNLRDVKFAVGAQLDKWAVLVIQDGGWDVVRDEDQKIANEFCKVCNNSGMRMKPVANAYKVQLPRKSEADRFRTNAVDTIERTLVGIKNSVDPQLILVLLTNDDESVYNGLKWLCDVQHDVATVCMQYSKAKECKPQYLANVALKANMKLGGINHKLDAKSGVWLKGAPTMIMGMDVTHPAVRLAAAGTPSIVAVVASVDQEFAQYPAILALRDSKVEIEREQNSILKDLFVSRFELYRARNKGTLPERVILFRDGVSESQYTQVRQYELIQMKRAFEHFGAYQPKLSIVVCGKRHHTRLYPTREGDAANDGNPLPGTVVDRGLTPAYEFDFFLQSHAALKGTARPTHYFVVHDENGFTADDLQRVTYDLSYLFARATKAVSLVSPAYWADVACERGRCYLHKLLMRHSEEDKGKGKGNEKGKGKKRVEEPSVSEEAAAMWKNAVSGSRLRDTMFYL